MQASRQAALRQQWRAAPQCVLPASPAMQAGPAGQRGSQASTLAPLFAARQPPSPGDLQARAADAPAAGAQAAGATGRLHACPLVCQVCCVVPRQRHGLRGVERVGGAPTVCAFEFGREVGVGELVKRTVALGRGGRGLRQGMCSEPGRRRREQRCTVGSGVAAE